MILPAPPAGGQGRALPARPLRTTFPRAPRGLLFPRDAPAPEAARRIPEAVPLWSRALAEPPRAQHGRARPQERAGPHRRGAPGPRPAPWGRPRYPEGLLGPARPGPGPTGCWPSALRGSPGRSRGQRGEGEAEGFITGKGWPRDGRGELGKAAAGWSWCAMS